MAVLGTEALEFDGQITMLAPLEVRELLAAHEDDGSIAMGAVCSIWKIALKLTQTSNPHLFRANRPRNSAACDEIRRIADGLLRSWEAPTPEDFMAQAASGADLVEADDNVVLFRPYGRVVVDEASR